MTPGGMEAFVIPVHQPVVAPLEQCWDPEEIQGDVHFTPEEMKEIKISPDKSLMELTE